MYNFCCRRGNKFIPPKGQHEQRHVSGNEGIWNMRNSKETKLNQYMIMAASLFHVSDWIETKEMKNLEG